jgi:hypothetical protein
MRAVAVAMVLAGVVAAEDGEVRVEVRDGPPVEGTLVEPGPLKVETAYGTLVIPASDLLSIRPGESCVLTHAGAVRGGLGWTELSVKTRFGEEKLPLKDVVRVTWKRERAPPEAKRYVSLKDGTSIGCTVEPGELAFATAYGALRIPLSEVRLLARDGDGCELRLADMTLRGEPRLAQWRIDTAYGVLHVPAPDLVRLASLPIPMEGDRMEGGYVVRAVGAQGGSVYALVARDRPMTWPEATDLAKRMGGHLATIGDEAENESLRLLSARMGTSPQPWIGFSDEGHEGDWQWVTGEHVRYRNWNPGEPNNSGGRENACELLPNGRWNDVDGGTGRAACLVEIDALG